MSNSSSLSLAGHSIKEKYVICVNVKEVSYRKYPIQSLNGGYKIKKKIRNSNDKNRVNVSKGWANSNEERLREDHRKGRDEFELRNNSDEGVVQI